MESVVVGLAVVGRFGDWVTPDLPGINVGGAPDQYDGYCIGLSLGIEAGLGAPVVP